MAELTNNNTITVEIAGQDQLDITVGSPMEHSRITQITENGKHVVSEYDLAEVDVSVFDAINYYWIMPHNQGAPNISLADLTSTFEIKFRRYTDTTIIYDDGYTSLVYEDNQFKARLNGGEWTETLVRETDVKTHTVKLTGTKLQLDYYVFDLVDGGHKWDYGQQLYIGSNLDVFYCKYTFANGGVASDYEPCAKNGEVVLRDAISGNVMSINKDTFEKHLNDVEQYLVTYVTNTNMVPTDNFKIKCKLRPYFPSKISYYSYFFLIPSENNTEKNNGSIWMINNNSLGCAMNGMDAYLNNNSFSQGDILEFELIYGKTQSTCTLWVNGEQRSIGTRPKYRTMTKSIMLGGSAFDYANYTYWYSLQMYANDVLVFDAKPKRVDNTNNYVFYDEISKKVVSTFVDDFNKLSGDATTLEAPIISDFKTITLTDEEYTAIAPILEELRGEEVVDNEPKPVVD